ncbi:hypothetical protein GOV11_05405 [Candidatus Woesearchaeota archaeon]|nr:hypothetical protein [Candidatus Woesearchaeota archaeon]
MRLPSKVKFIDEKIELSFEQLRDENLCKWLTRAFDSLEKNAFSGVQIQKKLIPKKYKVKNLWKYNLPNGWRLMYSIYANEIIVISLILEWLPHNEYEKRFKY